MSKTYQLDQMKLFCAIAESIAEQCPEIPADSRANVVIEAANLICSAYAMTDEEYVVSKETA